MRSSIRDIFVSRGTRRAALVITVVLPVLLAAYAWFMNHRPALHVKAEWTWQDTLIQNSDLLLSFVFLFVSALPFYLVFDRKKVKARELTPIALMAALCVVGRAAFCPDPAAELQAGQCHHHHHGTGIWPGSRISHRGTGGNLKQLSVRAGTMDAVADVLLGTSWISGWYPLSYRTFRTCGADTSQ